MILFVSDNVRTPNKSSPWAIFPFQYYHYDKPVAKIYF